jgi:hypothetical protein
LKRVDLARKLNVKSGSLSDKLNKLQNLDLIHFTNGNMKFQKNYLKDGLKLSIHKRESILIEFNLIAEN